MKLNHLTCPDCSAKLLPGPMGGAAQNFYCTDRETCREGFNLVIFNGQLLGWERIGEVDDQRYAMYARKSHDHRPRQI